MWQSGLLLMLAATTSVLAALLTPALRSNQRSLARAIRLVLEMTGIAALFLVGNLVLGVTIVLAIRSLSRAFVSIYMLNDAALVALSALQGALFFCWRRSRPD